MHIWNEIKTQTLHIHGSIENTNKNNPLLSQIENCKNASVQHKQTVDMTLLCKAVRSRKNAKRLLSSVKTEMKASKRFWN